LDDQPINATYDYQPWENYRVQRAIARRSGHPSLYTFMGVVFLILGSAIMISHPYDPRASFLHLWYVFTIPFVAFVVIPGSQIIAAFRHRHHPTLPHTDHTVVLSPSGVGVICAAVKAEFPWKALLRVEETGEFFLFYVSRARALYLPKRSLASEQELTAVREIARRHGGERVEF
jgi:hypothetical protein